MRATVCLSIALTLFALQGCALLNISDSSTPKVFAHRGLSGQWHQNSRLSVEQTLQGIQNKNLSVQGLELDVVLTRDGVPVFSHDPWVHLQLCRRTNGEPMIEMLIKDFTLKEIQQQFECGLPDPAFAQAKRRLETIYSMPELLALLKQYPKVPLYLDVKIDKGLTAKPHEYARALAHYWRNAALPNPLFLEGPSLAALATYRQAFTGLPYTAVLSYPAFGALENWTQVGAVAAAKTAGRPTRPVEKARNAQAQAIAVPLVVMNPMAARQLQKAEIDFYVYPVNNQADYSKACELGAKWVLADFELNRECNEP